MKIEVIYPKNYETLGHPIILNSDFSTLSNRYLHIPRFPNQVKIAVIVANLIRTYPRTNKNVLRTAQRVYRLSKYVHVPINLVHKNL